MPLQLEIVTPERRSLFGRGRLRAAARLGGRARRPAPPRAARLHARRRRAAHPQGRRGGVVRDRRRVPPGPARQGRGLAETADMASEIDLEKAREARREAERALESGYHEGADLATARPLSSRRSFGSASQNDAIARVPATAARLMADARPFHWEYVPEPVTREVFRVEGGRPLSGSVPISGAKNAALKMLAAATLTGERCRITNVPEIEDVASWPRPCSSWASSSTIRRTTSTRSPRATSSGSSSRSRPRPRCAPRSCCLARSSRASAGSSSATRAVTGSAGGRSTSTSTPCDALGADRLPQRLLLRHGAGSAARPRSASLRPVMGTENAMLAATLAEGHTVIRPAAQEPEVDDLIAFLQKMGAEVERTFPDTVEVDGKRRLRGAEHRVIPDRIEAGTFVIAGAVTGGRIAHQRALRPPRRIPRGRRADRGRGQLRDRYDRHRRLGAGRCRFRAVDVETGPYPGSPRTSSRRPRCCSARRRGLARARDDLRGPARLAVRAPRMGAEVDIVDPHHAVITGRAAPRSRRGHRRPPRRCLADRRPGGRWRDHDPRCSPRSPGL